MPRLNFRGRVIWSGGGVKEDRLGARVDGGSTPYPVYPYGEQRSQYYVVYATYPRDTNGLDYAMNRWYSSQVARFTTPDPYQASGGAADPQSWNRYSYVQNDPVNFVDPEGLRRRDGDGVWLNGGILIGGFGSGLSVEGGLGGPPSPAVVIGAGPAFGGGSGGAPPANKAGWYTKPSDAAKTGWQYLSSIWDDCLNFFEQDAKRFSVAKLKTLLTSSSDKGGMSWWDTRNSAVAVKTIGSLNNIADTTHLKDFVNAKG